MVRPVGFGPVVPLRQSEGDPPASGGTAVTPGAPPSEQAPAGSAPAGASSAAPAAPRPVTLSEAMQFVEGLGWVAIKITDVKRRGKLRGTDERANHWYIPLLGAELAKDYDDNIRTRKALGALRRAQNPSQLRLAIGQLYYSVNPGDQITGEYLKRVAVKLDPQFLERSIEICLDNIVNNKDGAKAVAPEYYIDKLYKMLGSPYRGGAEKSALIPLVIDALRGMKDPDPKKKITAAAAAQKLAKDPQFRISVGVALAAGGAPAPSGVVPGYSDEAVRLAKEIVSTRAKQKGEPLTEAQIAEEAGKLLKDGYRGYEDYPSALVGKLRGDLELAQQEQAKDNKRAGGFLIISGSHTGGPNGEKNKAEEDRTGMGGLTVVAGAGFKITDVFGVSGVFHYSGGKTDPLSGLPPRFHYFGGRNKGTSSALAVDEAVVTAEIPLVRDKFSLELKLGITDLDARDELSAGKVMALAGNTYSLAKHSPIYNSPLGGSFRLSGNVSPEVSMYLSGAAGKLPEYKIDNAAKAVSAASDDTGDDVISKELRAGFQWAEKPKAPKTGHLVAFQGQLYHGDKTSYGTYGTAQFYLSPGWAAQASARLFSLDDGGSSDVGVYVASVHRLSSKVTISAYASHVSRTKNERGAAKGNLGTDATGAPVPNDGAMTDTFAVSITQFGGELVFDVTAHLKLKAAAAALRTNPRAGSEENPNWRLFLNFGLMANF